MLLIQCKITSRKKWCVDVLNHSKILKYANDTVLYVAYKDIQIINAKLSIDIDWLAHWLKGNELVLNLKKGKTESLLFGTSQRIAKDYVIWLHFGRVKFNSDQNVV